MRKLSGIGLLSLALFLVLGGCNPMQPASSTSTSASSSRSFTISWSLATSSSARTIMPSSSSYPSPSTYSVSLTPASGSAITQTGLTSTSWTFNNLATAVYTITVTGYDGSGNVLVKGTGSADLTQSTVPTPAITLSYITSGTGTGQINLTFSIPSTITVSSTSFTLVGPSGSVISGASLSGSSPTFSYTNSSASAGSYSMVAKFTSSSGTVAYKMDTIVVVQDISTTATVTLATTDFTSAYVAVTSLGLSSSSLSIILGQPAQSLTATFTPSGASNTLVSWSTSNSSVATVNTNGNETASVTAQSVGTATITATSIDNPSAKATCTVTVTQYTLTVIGSPSGDGLVTGEGQVSYNAATTITAKADTGYIFSGWSVASGTASITSSSSATTTVSLTSGNATVQATFAAIAASISPTASNVLGSNAVPYLVTTNARPER